MDKQIHSTLQHHLIAWTGNILILTGLSGLFYVILILATADVGGPLNLVIVPCANCCTATIATVIVFAPISMIMERILRQTKPTLQARIFSLQTAGFVFSVNLVLILGGFVLILGVILQNQFALQLVGGYDRETVVVGLFRVLFLGGIPFLLGGTLYWFLLRVSDRLRMSQTKNG